METSRKGSLQGGILIAASGTGGHLFPALFIARALQRLAPEGQIYFLGAGKELERKIIDGAGFSREVIDIVGLKRRGVRGLIEFLAKLPRAALQCWRILSTLNPTAIVGVGGYVTVLPVILGRLRGIPSWIHEAELRPGMANAVLSLFASRVSVGFPDAHLPIWARKERTGHPVREDLPARTDVEWGFIPRKILILGGSQGARGIDEGCLALAAFFSERGFSLLHQTRVENREIVSAGYKAAQVDARVVSFVDNVGDAYGWCDLIIARAGAGTVMEIGVVGKPAIFVPYPFAQGNHQKANAETLARVGKALIVEEGQEFSSRLRSALARVTDPAEYARMRNAPAVERSREAADRIAAGVLSLRR